MNLRAVESFYWVVMLRSVTRAAEKLHLTQSAMSSRVAMLEQELGMLLLDRRDKQFRITPAGQRFFVHAERLLALQHEILAEMGTVASQPVLLKVGAFESASHSWLMDWVRSVHKVQPMLALELTVETSPVLVDLLSRGALDIAIAALPAAGAGVRSMALPSMAMRFVGHVDHHTRRSWTPADLAALELITFQRGSQPHVALLDLFHRAEVEPKRVHTVSSISAMTQLVEDGLGVATLPEAVLQRLRRRMPLKALNCRTRLPPLPTHLSWRVEPTSTVQSLVDSLLTHLGVDPDHQKTR
ncbi:LysR family transcriptional regulator [Piscinibacter sakaiensis]|uniref:LysR family transcriptional regulator n=1 Tax=Piscinibacter sakaiensis TaxID=1547922 RepID=UPI003AAE3FA8